MPAAVLSSVRESIGTFRLRCKQVNKSLEQIRQSMSAGMLRNMFDHHEARMQRVVDMGGDNINK